LFGKELLGMLIEFRWRTWIYEKHTCFPGCKVGAVLDKVMHLLYAIRALIPRKAA
jgi:hypothetical protein